MLWSVFHEFVNLNIHDLCVLWLMWLTMDDNENIGRLFSNNPDRTRPWLADFDSRRTNFFEKFLRPPLNEILRNQQKIGRTWNTHKTTKRVASLKKLTEPSHFYFLRVNYERMESTNQYVPVFGVERLPTETLRSDLGSVAAYPFLLLISRNKILDYYLFWTQK